MQVRVLKAIQKIALAPNWPARPFSTVPNHHVYLADLDDSQPEGVTKESKTTRSQAPPAKRKNSLPLSSYFDPTRIAQRHRHNHVKPPAPLIPELDAFRMRVASNPYAHLLAKGGVRQDELTKAHLPDSFLLKFNPMRTELEGGRAVYVSLPVGLYTQADPKWWVAAGLPGIPSLRTPTHFPLRAPFYTPGEGKAEGPSTDADKASYTLPRGTVKTLSFLLARLVERTIAYPLRGGQHVLPLNGELDERGVPLDRHRVPNVAGILYFGGRCRTRRTIQLEQRVARETKILLKMLSSQGAMRKRLKESGHHKSLAMHPRATAPILQLPTVIYEYVGDSASESSHAAADETSWVPTAYRVPVFNMVEILGEAAAQRLLEYGGHGNGPWFCVKACHLTANALAALNRAAWWFEEAAIPEADHDELKSE